MKITFLPPAVVNYHWSESG